MNSWSFPPQTREVQFDEKWSYVGKKEKHCDSADPTDALLGDAWDHVAFDPEHRLVVSWKVGKRTWKRAQELVEDFQRRTEGRLMNLITTDEYAAYPDVILKAYGEWVRPQRTGKRGRPRKGQLVPREGLVYATVHKERRRGRLVKIEYRAVYGSQEAVAQALKASSVSRQINTAFVERYNATDRLFNARKVRKSYRFSKEWEQHKAATYFAAYSYNFCWAVRTLRERDEDGAWRDCTPAMAAGLTDHIWPLAEWLAHPALQRE